jgi:ABC-type nitrate/sulfonate/bicarbonate transport system substrate-binding protein
MINKKLSLVIFLVTLFIISGCTQQEEKYVGPMEDLTIGATVQELSTLIWVAQEKGYFEENGLNAVVKPYDTGIETKNALLLGEVDIADTVDFVITNMGLEEIGFKVLSSISMSTINHITARKDQGINSISDLKNRRIGIKKGSSAEYYLGRTLTFNGLSIGDVELVYLHPPEMPESIAQGEVDAVITWHPHNFHLKNSLGDNVISWNAHNNQNVHWVALSKNEFVQKHPEKIKRFLKALIQAEEFVKNNELKAKKSVANLVNSDLDYIDSVWLDFQFTVNLPQGMILGMEDQARWIVENNLTTATEIPNYLHYIHIDALEEIKPEAVTIIR